MTIEVKKELNFENIKEMAWSGAVYTINIIDDNGKGNEFMQLLTEIFTETPTDTDINDFLWHDSDYILDTLGITDDEEENGEE